LSGTKPRVGRSGWPTDGAGGVSTADIACLAEATAECIRKVGPIISSQAAQVADHRHRRLLRAVDAEEMRANSRQNP
jgi:histone H3/H4